MRMSPASFHTTRWTQVRSAKANSEDGRRALADLCDAYYEPVLAFLRYELRDADAARDLAHDFFAKLLSSAQSLKPDRERGRFRSYLLGAVKHFVSDMLDRERSQKRGGAAEMLHLTESGPSLVDDSLTPDRAFDRQWALTVLERVIRGLEVEFVAAVRD